MLGSRETQSYSTGSAHGSWNDFHGGYGIRTRFAGWKPPTIAPRGRHAGLLECLGGASRALTVTHTSLGGLGGASWHAGDGLGETLTHCL